MRLYTVRFVSLRIIVARLISFDNQTDANNLGVDPLLSFPLWMAQSNTVCPTHLQRDDL